MIKREHKVSNISSEAIFAIPAMKPTRVILALCFCLVLMLTDIRYNSSSFIRIHVVDLLKPLSLISEVPNSVYSAIENYFFSRSYLEEKLKDLEKENLKLKASNKITSKLSLDITRLNSLWSAVNLDLNRYLIAKKNFLSSNEYQPTLILNIDQQQKVKQNSAVLSDRGLIGRVTKIGTFSTEVLLMHDVRSSIPIVTESSSLHAILQGKGLYRHGELAFIKKSAEFKEGERVFTSGLGGVFPEGIPVGRIVSISDLVDEEFLNIKINFFSSPVNKDFFLLYRNE